MYNIVPVLYGTIWYCIVVGYNIVHTVYHTQDLYVLYHTAREVDFVKLCELVGEQPISRSVCPEPRPRE